MVFLTRVLLLAKLHMINGLQRWFMPRLRDAMYELPSDSIQYRMLEKTESKIMEEHESVLESLGR